MSSGDLENDNENGDDSPEAVDAHEVVSDTSTGNGGMTERHRYENPWGITAGELWNILTAHFEDSAGDTSSSKAVVRVRPPNLCEDSQPLTSVEVSGQTVILHYASQPESGSAEQADQGSSDESGNDQL